MSIKKFAVSGIVLSLLFFPLWAQLDDISENPGFSAESVKFNFSGPSGGADATDLIAGWGVVFGRSGAGSARINAQFGGGSVNNSVRHFHPSGSSANRPLVLNFRNPVSKVGFALSNAGVAGQATVSAFDPVGIEIGQITVASPVDEAVALAVGTSHPEGISKLLVSFGSDASPEQIDELQIEYLDRPVFETYLAQIGNGVIPGVGTLRTSIVVSNLSNSTARGELQFIGSDGLPLPIQIGEETASAFPLTIPAFSSASFTTGGTALAVGYARIESAVPVEGTGVFRIVGEDGTVLTEAGVGGAQGKIVSIGAVQKAFAAGFDSGIAVVNTGNREAVARAELYNQVGTQVAVSPDVVNLGPGQHNAQFLSQIFPSIEDQDFDGTLKIVSDVPIAVVILRTSGGLVLSSLPVGSTER